MADSSDRIAALFVATVLTKNNATTSMEPVPVDVMTATKAETVPKVLKGHGHDGHGQILFFCFYYLQCLRKSFLIIK